MTDSIQLNSAPPEAASALMRLAASDATVRRIAVLDLADLEDATLVPPLVAALRDDPSPEVRREAALVLSSWEQEDVVEALCAALLDADAGVREAAQQALAELKEPGSARVLRRWAARPESFARRAALRGLRELRDAAAFEPALAALADADAEVRLEAVAVLGWLKDVRAVAPLAALATADAHGAVRRAAAGALGFATVDEMNETHAGAALLHALADADWQVREEAATTLGKLRTPTARDALIHALADDYWQVRLRAARALGRLGDAHAATAVSALLAHPISNLRKEAALALGELPSAASLAPLRAALDDRDPEVRKAVRIALQQLAQRLDGRLDGRLAVWLEGGAP
ncbi:HEAT repeat domain-containing protein [Paraburkholderia tagetis]|uniref:HEAT repeat domain-containing protein n=1 Tax=Paraburkholderia tagetis TaxID=2913261 RepID=A0A9X1ZXF0_9BURK|nr:HEAT repeat domain-containing protein [Paraburkholderia tagetis]MCG5077717.1 HEAT repeat domain-containing protein [Paraburkholderia tagetis]